MNIMKSCEVPRSTKRFSGSPALLHRCPVCDVAHEVSALRAQFAYGRQLACSPDCEAERRRRMRPALRLVSGAEPKVSLPVTVESVDVLRVRRAVFQSAAESVDVLKAVAVPHSSKVRLLVSIKANALEAITAAIMRAVPAGEFGRIGRA